MRGISLPAKQLLASQEGLRSVEIVIYMNKCYLCLSIVILRASLQYI
jgi:hypothetical protein